MNFRMGYLISTCALGLLVNGFAFGQDFEQAKLNNWHQWRGPDASGVAATDANPPTQWSDQSNIKWKVPIVGEGSSTPIVWGNQVFILSAIETDRKPDVAPVRHPDTRTELPSNVFQFVVWSFDRNTGDVLWKKVVTEAAPIEGRHSTTTYAAASPTTDGKYVYASFGSYGVFCLTTKGDLVWKRDLGDMRTRRGWGEAVSPVLHDGKLVVNWDQEEQSAIFVLNATDGETIWKKDRTEPTTWATPLVAVVDGRTQLITNGTNSVISYDLTNGAIIWEAPGTTLNAIPCPVRSGDQVICMGGYQGKAAISIDLRSQGRVKNVVGPEEKIKWRLDQHTSYVPSPVVTNGRVYFTKSNRAILSCLDAETGEMIFKNQDGVAEPVRLPELKNMYASPVVASDQIFLTSREGTTLVIKNSPKFEVLSTNRLSEEIDASPAIVGGQIFLRGKKNLYCVEQAN